MSSEFGAHIAISIFGQSHAPAIGVVIDGLPAGEVIDIDKMQAFLLRRAPGRSAHATARQEADTPVILSGMVGNTTCGAPLCAVIENKDADSKDYEDLRDIPRPSHSDYAAFMKYGPFHDIRGGGHFSGRLTAPLCIAGAVCIQLLEKRGVTIGSHIASIGFVDDIPFDPIGVDAALLERTRAKAFPVVDDSAGEKMVAQILEAAEEGDSLGGVVEGCAVNVPAGVGQPMFDGIENAMARIVFGIPAVKGVEFGAGFACARMKGSQSNDAFHYDAAGRVKTRTNNHGGCLGGIASGMPILMRAAFKPTPSIAREQGSVSFNEKTNVALAVKGRHDPCIVPRAVPCVEAAMAIALLELMFARAAEAAF